MGKKVQPPSPWQLSLWDRSELERCASHIRADLGVSEPPDYEQAIYLAEVHGGPPEPAAVEYGETVGHSLRVNPLLPLSALSVVILHELIHRLANGPRYEELNPVKTAIPRRIWLELLIRLVARQED